MNYAKFLRAFAASAICSAIVSCTDSSYDLSEIDPSVDIKADLSIPVGNSGFIRVGDLLELGDELVSADADGNYFLSFRADEAVTSDISVPSFDFNHTSSMDAAYLHFPSSSNSFGKLPEGLTPEEIHRRYPDIDLTYVFPITNPENPSESFMMDFDIDADLPDAFTDIRYASIDAEVRLDIGLEGRITFMEGAEIVFPQYLVLASVQKDSRLQVSGGHSIRLKQDMTVDRAESVSVQVEGVDLSQVPGHGIIVENGSRQLMISEAVTVNGNVRIDLLDFDRVPTMDNGIPVKMQFVLDRFSVFRAQVKLDVAKSAEGTDLVLSDVPDILSADNVTLDVWNPMLLLEFDNSSPVIARLDADMQAFKGDTQTADIHIGTNGPADNRTEPIQINPGSQAFCLSRQGTSAWPDAKAVKAERLSMLFNTVPEVISFRNIRLRTPDEWVELDLTDNAYTVSFDYAVQCPLAFGRKLSIQYEIPVGGMGGLLAGEGIELERAELRFDITNSIPWNMTLDATAMDSEGNPIESGVVISMNPAIVAAGSTDSPSVSPVAISISSEKGALQEFDGFLLRLKLEGDAQLEGLPLNENQGIRLTDISASIKGEVSIRE